MRLIDLTFECYGPFQNLCLHFDPQARVHIVHGPNEAGKSCALQGLGDLFYGAPRRAGITFLRPRDLRIAATLRGRNGQMLQFTRRRGDKNTLLDASGAVLPDDALSPFLGAATREIFHRAFGLDADRLRKGGDEMLNADGEIGASLFAAASGLRSLIELKKEFDAQAGEIFSDRKASHRSFYQALDRFESAREQERASTLHESVLKTLKSEITGAREQMVEIENTRKLALAEKQRLTRLLKTAPILKTLARLSGDFSAFDDLAALPPDWAQNLTTVLQAQEQGAEAAARAAQTLEAARLECEDAVVDESLLAQAEKIENLIRASGAYEKSAADLPRREDALREARQTLQRRAQECGLANAESLRAAAPDARMLKHAEKLCEHGRELETRLQEPQRALAEEEAFFARMRAAQPPQPAQDPQILREKWAALGPIAQWDANGREASLAASEAARALAEKCARLAPPLTDLDHFAVSPSPDLASIEQAARFFEAIDTSEKAARQKAQEARTALESAEKTLAQLERLGAVASIESLHQARADRDAAWSGLRAFLRGDSPTPDDALWTEKAERYEGLATEADRRADALLADSARVAAADAARENIAGARRQAEEAERLLAEATRDRAQQEAAWAQAWKACGVAPLAPREMAAWRGRADSLLEAREALAALHAKARGWDLRLAEARPHLEALSGDCGLAPLENLECATLARRVEARLAELAKAQDAAREAQAKIADAPNRIAQWKERLAVIAGEQGRWREEWRAALAALRLDDDASFDEAQKRIALWRALPSEAEDESEKLLRAQKIAADMAEFERGLDALLALCGRDISARPVEIAVGCLRNRLSRAREKSALRLKARERLEKAKAAAQKAGAELAQTRGALEVFRATAAQAGLDGALETLLLRFGERQKFGDAIKTERERLFLVADGFDEAALAEEAAFFDADAARGKLAEIDRELKTEEDRAREIFASLRAAETRWTSLQTGLGAEAAIQAKANAHAEIMQESRRWAVLKLASLLVESGLERCRERRKDPLLARAGTLFSTLTNRKYIGLDQAFGEDDCLHLQARRSYGAALDLAALSEGARDQLYIALRLAFLEDYAQRTEAPPFIGDDLFASFDDSRVAAGLGALAEASAYLQPIIFTHHEHIVEIARSALGEGAQILRLA
jgi:uncharacterized protein YhaN